MAINYKDLEKPSRKTRSTMLGNTATDAENV